MDGQLWDERRGGGAERYMQECYMVGEGLNNAVHAGMLSGIGRG